MIPTFANMEDQRQTADGPVHKHTFPNGFTAFVAHTKGDYVVRAMETYYEPARPNSACFREASTAFGAARVVSSLLACNLAIRAIAELQEDGKSLEQLAGETDEQWWQK